MDTVYRSMQYGWLVWTITNKWMQCRRLGFKTWSWKNQTFSSKLCISCLIWPYFYMILKLTRLLLKHLADMTFNFIITGGFKALSNVHLIAGFVWVNFQCLQNFTSIARCITIMFQFFYMIFNTAQDQLSLIVHGDVWTFGSSDRLTQHRGRLLVYWNICNHMVIKE